MNERGHASLAGLMVALLVIVPLNAPSPAVASDDEERPSVTPGTGALGVEYGRSGDSSSGGGSSSPIGEGGDPEPGHWATEPVCVLGGAETCAETAVCRDGSQAEVTFFVFDRGGTSRPVSSCASGTEPPVVVPVITQAMVANAFRRIPLPASPLNIQPPNGRTLVNFDTNFFTEERELTRSVTLLGQRVDLRIWVAEYEWQFGDGESTSTTEPGAPYPDLQITHNYGQKDVYAPQVDTTYAADYRVNGGPWQPVVGTVFVAGTPERLEAVEARPVLTDS